ncbi:phage minor capsid protein, partial [Streptococcus pneumoniae]|uniref:phage minor capsid protein n=1 Tax=Streptococcus pneumoniae TaxID=1313 RepID=UPI001EFE1DC5
MKKKRKQITFNDQQFPLQMQGVGDIYEKLQIDIFDRMIKRLKERGSLDLMRNPYIWQLEKLNDMHMLNEQNLKLISERTGIAERLLRDVIGINEWFESIKTNKNYLAHSSTYLDDELGFVTEQMLEDIERIKENDYDYYRYLYLGEGIDTIPIAHAVNLTDEQIKA